MSIEEFNRLVKQINKGNAKAFTTIYDYYYPRIVMHIASRYPKLSPRDIAQEFFLNLLQIQNFKRINNPTAWVLTSCDNIAKKILRIDHVIDCAEEDIMDFLHPNIDAIEKYAEMDYIKGLLKHIDSVSQEIFYLYYREGYNLREISELLEIKLATVKQKHVRGVEKLKKFL